MGSPGIEPGRCFPQTSYKAVGIEPTSSLTTTMVLPIIIGAPPEIRTPTIPGLNRLPLPIGLEGHNMVRLARLELARYYYREILSLPCLPIPSQAHNGGGSRIRTGDAAVKVPCLNRLTIPQQLEGCIPFVHRPPKHYPVVILSGRSCICVYETEKERNLQDFRLAHSIWWFQRDSNPQPDAYEAFAQPLSFGTIRRDGMAICRLW